MPHVLPSFSTPEGGDTHASWPSLCSTDCSTCSIPVVPSPESTHTHAHTQTHTNQNEGGDLRQDFHSFQLLACSSFPATALFCKIQPPWCPQILHSVSSAKGDHHSMSASLSTTSPPLFPGSKLGDHEAHFLCCLSLGVHRSAGFCGQCLNTVLCLFLKSFKEGGCEG